MRSPLGKLALGTAWCHECQCRHKPGDHLVVTERLSCGKCGEIVDPCHCSRNSLRRVSRPIKGGS